MFAFCSINSESLDLDALVQKIETWNVIYLSAKQLTNISLFFLELAFKLYKRVDYWHRYAEANEL